MYATTSAPHHATSDGAGPEHAGPNGNNGHNEFGGETDEDAPVDADFAFVDDGKKN